MEHDHDHDMPEGDLLLSLALTSFYMVIELAGGYFSGSLSLLSDAVHMFRDSFSLLLSWSALRLSQEFPTDVRTFGYHRTEIFASLLNGALLFIAGVGILAWAFVRLGSPNKIESGLMFWVALVGLGVNGLIMLRLKGHEDLNIKSAYLHVLWDTVSSVAVVVGAVLIYFTGITVFDVVVSVALAVLVLKSSVELMSESVHILLMGVPKGIDVDEVIAEMKRVSGVLDVHRVHLWTLCSNINVLDAHIHSCETKLERTCEMTALLNKRLEKFDIKHTTFQYECDRCSLGKLKHIKH